METVMVTVTKEHMPSARWDYTKFFWSGVSDTGREYKGMAPNRMYDSMPVGALLRLEGRERSGWFNISALWIVSMPTPEIEEETLHLGHVGSRKRLGETWVYSAQTVQGEWVTIPVLVASRFFTGEEDERFPFPNRGKCEIKVRLTRNGNTRVVEILDWIPNMVQVATWVAREDIDHKRGFMRINGQWVLTYWELSRYGADVFFLVPGVYVKGTLMEVSKGLSRSEYVWMSEPLIYLDPDTEEKVRTLIWTDKVQRIVKEVWEKVRVMLSSGTALVEADIVRMLQEQGLEDGAEKEARAMFTAGNYDSRYLEALTEMCSDLWVVEEGFLGRRGEWLIWERCKIGAATYILPGRCPKVHDPDGEVSREEWVGTLAKVLPMVQLMDLRHGPVGKALSGSNDGCRYAMHTEDDEGNIDGWLERVRRATTGRPMEEWENPVPALEKVLASLGTGDE